MTRQLARDSLLEGVSLDPVGAAPGWRLPVGAGLRAVAHDRSRAPPSTRRVGHASPSTGCATAALAPRDPPPPRPGHPGATPTRVAAASWTRLVAVAGRGGRRAGVAGDGDPGEVRRDEPTSHRPSPRRPPRPRPRRFPSGPSAIPPAATATATFTPGCRSRLDGGWRSLKGEYGDIVDLVAGVRATTSLLTFVRVGPGVRHRTRPRQTMAEIEQATTRRRRRRRRLAGLASPARGHVRSRSTWAGDRACGSRSRCAPGRVYPDDRCPSRCVLLFRSRHPRPALRAGRGQPEPARRLRHRGGHAGDRRPRPRRPRSTTSAPPSTGSWPP